ncbi:MAG: right-handed parallel beta-helix repeat-containing protein [Verrucomicrobia bacterium]|nr:right-handed parallel beta-helix repeat-containing protein [Verrucomicrobiota bacterium]
MKTKTIVANGLAMATPWIAALALASASAPVESLFTVAQDGSGRFNGANEQPIQAAIDTARGQGGGEIVIGGGEYLIRSSLRIAGATNLTIRGKPGAVLRLPPMPHALTLKAAAAGASALSVDNVAGFTNGTRLHFCAPGKLDRFTGKPAPYFIAKLARTEPSRLLLTEPLAFVAPAQTQLYPEDEPNIFRIAKTSTGILIESLTLDGGRRASDQKISGHVIRCGVLAEGAYSYEGGPIGPPVRGLTVRRCVIRQCFGRGVAMYAVSGGAVEDCVIEDTVDEAIDFDHFATGCRATGNRVARCHVGVELNDANDCLVRSNRVEACDAGINLWRWCRQPELNVRNLILDNQFFDTSRSVLAIQAGTASNVVSGNLIRGCGGIGVVLGGSRQTLASNTVCAARGVAIAITGNDNEVTGNRCEAVRVAGKRAAVAIRITGDRNRVTGNVVQFPPGIAVQAVQDRGKENHVSAP